MENMAMKKGSFTQKVFATIQAKRACTTKEVSKAIGKKLRFAKIIRERLDK